MFHTALVQAGPGSYIHWGWLSISLTNLLIIATMLLVFLLALVVPFGHRPPEAGTDEPRETSTAEEQARS
jgi:hypothetical protein